MTETGNLYYFLADVHLGIGVGDKKALEERFVSFLKALPSNTKALYLLGDIFDFWYEYKYVIPRGHTRALGQLAELVDRGVEVYFFEGNHDCWAYSYFQDEIGMKVLRQPYVVEIEGKTFCLGHGDGLGTTSSGFRFIRWVFHSRWAQVLFSSLHPRWGFELGYSWSRQSRLAKSASGKDYVFKGIEDPIVRFANDFGSTHHVDYYIFGHFHTPNSIDVPSGGHLYILGDWIHHPDYLVYSPSQEELTFQNIL